MSAVELRAQPAVVAPPDATEVADWVRCDPDLARRTFTGTVREAAGFQVWIEGFQRENGTCRRRVVVDANSSSTQLEPQAVRQLASVLNAAVDEIGALR